MITIYPRRCQPGGCSHCYCEYPPTNLDTDDMSEALEYAGDLVMNRFFTDVYMETEAGSFRLEFRRSTGEYSWKEG